MSGRSARLERSLLLLCAGLLIGGVVIHAYLSLYSRFLADDYCTYGVLQTEGFWGSQRYWYLNWSGRYAFLFTMTSIQLLGPGATPAVPALLLAFWAVALVALFSRLLSRFSITASGAAATLGLAALIGTLSAAPNLYQSLYWQTGAVTYALPTALATAYGVWLISESRRSNPSPLGWRPVVISGTWAFVMGGFSETNVSMQIAAMALLALGSFLPAAPKDRMPPRRLTIAGLVGSLVALGFIAFSPGSNLRQLLMPAPGNLLSIGGQSIRYMLSFAANSLLDHPLSFLLPAGIALLFGFLAGSPPAAATGSAGSEANRQRALWIVPLVAAILITAGVMPSAYAISAYPSARALLPPAFALTLAVVLWSLSLGKSFGDRWGANIARASSERGMAVALTAFCIGLAAMSLHTVSQWSPDMSSFAVLWGNRDARIRAAVAEGNLALQEASLPHIGGLAELDSAPTNWLNRCIAMSYDLESITAR